MCKIDYFRLSISFFFFFEYYKYAVEAVSPKRPLQTSTARIWCVFTRFFSCRWNTWIWYSRIGWHQSWAGRKSPVWTAHAALRRPCRRDILPPLWARLSSGKSPGCCRWSGKRTRSKRGKGGERAFVVIKSLQLAICFRFATTILSEFGFAEEFTLMESSTVWSNNAESKSSLASCNRERKKGEKTPALVCLQLQHPLQTTCSVALSEWCTPRHAQDLHSNWAHTYIEIFNLCEVVAQLPEPHRKALHEAAAPVVADRAGWSPGQEGEQSQNGQQVRQRSHAAAQEERMSGSGGVKTDGRRWGSEGRILQKFCWKCLNDRLFEPISSPNIYGCHTANRRGVPEREMVKHASYM